MTIKSISQSKRVCQVEGCEHIVRTSNFCNRHYCQIRQYGEVFGNPKVGRKDPNEFTVEGDVCKISLRDNLGFCKAYALIDVSDIPAVKKHKWYVNNYNMVGTNLHGSSLLLHHLILGYPPEGKNVDHKNLNRLDNRRCNLRFATRSQNVANKPKLITNTSGFKGVYLDKRRKTWYAKIQYQKKGIYLGSFDSKVAAAQVYNEAAIKYFGEFAYLNSIPGEA